MRRWLVVILILLAAIILFPLTVGGQSRGRGSVFSGQSGPVRPIAPVGPVVTPGPARPVQPAPPFAVARPGPPIAHNPRGAGSRVRGPVIVTQPFGFYPSYSPFYTTPVYGYPGYGYSGSYVQPAYPEPSYSAPSQPSVSQNEVDLAYQVGQLTQEVERLRQEQTLRQLQPPPPQPPAPTQPAVEPTPTVLIFRDGHHIEIVNYAIMGQTLYVMDGAIFTKIPLADLNLDATRKENQQRGLRFLSGR